MAGHHPFSQLRSRMSPAARAESERVAKELEVEMPLAALRHALELSQEQIAETMDVDQPTISRLERRTDMMISTLSRYIEAMGGRLEVKAVFPSGEVTITGLELARLSRVP